jgi:hypothetical protein
VTITGLQLYQYLNGQLIALGRTPITLGALPVVTSAGFGLAPFGTGPFGR